MDRKGRLHVKSGPTYEMISSESTEQNHAERGYAPFQHTHNTSFTGINDPYLHGSGMPRRFSGDTQNSSQFRPSLHSRTSSRPLIGDNTLGRTRSHVCTVRSDDSGPWNVFKGWSVFLLHIFACVAVMISIIYIDGHQFQIGSGSSIFSRDSPLHQTQVTGLISFALVIIRIIAGSCSALLAWRIVYILLEKRGITLAELTRLTSWRMPVALSTDRRRSLLWSIWAATATLFLWPQSFAAPFASSSVSWIPGTRVLDLTKQASVATVGTDADWGFVLYPNYRAFPIMAAAAMSAKEPSYAFDSSGIPLRRHFNTSQTIPAGSIIDIASPYFDVKLQWVDSSKHSEFGNAENPEYVTVNSNFSMRNHGATAIIRDAPFYAWDWDSAQLTTFRGTKFVTVMLQTININDTLPDGTVVKEGTKCPTVSPDFGQLPNVEQEQIPWYWEGGDNDGQLVAYDCLICAEATITAGKYAAKNCTVALNERNAEYATCHVHDDDGTSVEDSLLTNLALEFMSEILQTTVMLNYSGPWISKSLDDYTSGTLTLGFSAAWNGLMLKLGTDSEPSTFRPAEAIVEASIDRSKLYIWLAMNCTLTISSILVLLAQSSSWTKTMRNTDLAPLTIDLSDISHSGQAEGLCNAATLGRKDRQLPKIMWAEGAPDADRRGFGADNSCRRRVVFMKESQDRNNWTNLGLK